MNRSDNQILNLVKGGQKSNDYNQQNSILNNEWDITKRNLNLSDNKQ